MNMTFGYQLYQAQRQPSRADQRLADARRGELAAALLRLLRPGRGKAAASDLHALEALWQLPASQPSQPAGLGSR